MGKKNRHRLLVRCGLPCVPSLKGRENVQFISLQHNLICRIDSLSSFRMLKVLNLYDNKIERISGLDTLASLRVLMLGKNRYRSIIMTDMTTLCYYTQGLGPVDGLPLISVFLPVYWPLYFLASFKSRIWNEQKWLVLHFSLCHCVCVFFCSFCALFQTLT